MTGQVGRLFEIEERRPVWLALSELFLDTDVSLMTEQIVSTLTASPYSIAELEEILVDEVYPVCRPNLLTIAGEWAGFDVEWLERRIMKRRASPLRRVHWFNLGRLSVRFSGDWRRVKELVLSRRQGISGGE